MRAGAMRHYISIERLTEQKDRHSAIKNVWVEVCKVYASIKPLTGRSLFAAQQNHSEVTGDILMRYRPDIDAKMRVVYEGKIYSIHAVIDPDLRHRELHLMVSEGVREN